MGKSRDQRRAAAHRDAVTPHVLTLKSKSASGGNQVATSLGFRHPGNMSDLKLTLGAARPRPDSRDNIDTGRAETRRALRTVPNSPAYLVQTLHTPNAGHAIQADLSKSADGRPLGHVKK